MATVEDVMVALTRVSERRRRWTGRSDLLLFLDEDHSLVVTSPDGLTQHRLGIRLKRRPPPKIAKLCSKALAHVTPSTCDLELKSLKESPTESLLQRISRDLEDMGFDTDSSESLRRLHEDPRYTEAVKRRYVLGAEDGFDLLYTVASDYLRELDRDHSSLPAEVAEMCLPRPLEEKDPEPKGDGSKSAPSTSTPPGAPRGVRSSSSHSLFVHSPWGPGLITKSTPKYVEKPLPLSQPRVRGVESSQTDVVPSGYMASTASSMTPSSSSTASPPSSSSTTSSRPPESLSPRSMSDSASSSPWLKVVTKGRRKPWQKRP